MCAATIEIGSSKKHSKTVTIPKKYEGYICPSVVSQKNWLGGETYGDVFAITKSGTSLRVTRTDKKEGWGMVLKIRCVAQGGPYSVGSRCACKADAPKGCDCSER